MFLTADERNADHNYVTAVAESGDNLQLYDFVLIRHEGRSWIGQVAAPNLNISTVGRQFDPIVLHAIKLYRQDKNVQLAEYVEGWRIRLLGEYVDGSLSTLRRRPGPGADVARLGHEPTVAVLGLPKLTAHRDGSTNAIGYLLNAEDVPLCVDRATFTHHAMISGGTGSGKSNTAANLIRQAAVLGFTVLVYDAKPDYQKMAQPNTDPGVSKVWPAFSQYGLGPAGAEGLTRVAIYGVGQAGLTGDYEGYDKVVGFRASDFNPYFFASLFFDPKVKVNQYEEFASACASLPRPFSLDDVLAEVQRRKGNYLAAQKPGHTVSPSAPRIHSLTADSIFRDVRRNRGRMQWLDSVGKRTASAPAGQNAFARSLFDGMVEAFDPAFFVSRPGIVHVDCSNLDPREYALFLSRFLYECQRHQTRHRGEAAIVQFVDEAHRIFDNDDSRYGNMLGREFNRVMREGRSLRHGVVISLQNASQVPAIVLNNVNTHIVMKQNNREVARAATQTMGKDFADQVLTLATGQALCRMFESSSTVLVQMAPSPYELQRSDNADE